MGSCGNYEHPLRDHTGLSGNEDVMAVADASLPEGYGWLYILSTSRSRRANYCPSSLLIKDVLCQRSDASSCVLYTMSGNRGGIHHSRY